MDYARCIAIEPNHCNAYYNRGITYSCLKLYQEAIADYNQAIVIKPQSALIYNNRGNACKKLQSYQKAIQRGLGGLPHERLNQEAIADYIQAIFFDPDYSDAYYNRGLVYYILQERSKSIKDLTLAANLFQKQGKQELGQQIFVKIKNLHGNQEAVRQ